MPHTPSAKKHQKTDEKRRIHNRAVKRTIKTEIKKFEDAVASGTLETAQKEFVVAVKKLDQAAARHQVPTTGFAAQRAVVGPAHDGAVAREAVGDPELAVVLAELEMRLRHRERAVGDLHEVVERLAGLRQRLASDEPRAEHGASLAGAEREDEAGRRARAGDR